MRHVSICAGKLLWATILACCLQASVVVLADETPLSKSGDDNPQLDEMSKRDWNNNLKMWGKRGWNSLHGGWGLKRSTPFWADQLGYPPPIDKRAWQKLQGGWGKRFAPDDEYTIQQLASMMEQEQNEPHYLDYEPEQDFEPNDDDKRDWRPGKFNQGWGKRNKWEKFRGAWGKRDPAWSNLKGIWGKRSVPDQVANK